MGLPSPVAPCREINYTKFARHNADALFQAGRRDDAIKAQKEAVQLRPNDKEIGEQLATFEKATEEKR